MIEDRHSEDFSKDHCIICLNSCMLVNLSGVRPSTVFTRCIRCNKSFYEFSSIPYFELVDMEAGIRSEPLW